MPARRRSVKGKYKYKKNRKNFKIPFFLLFAAVFFVLFIYFYKSRTWIGDGKLSLAINGGSEIYIAVFDKKQGDINIVEIPGKVEVDVSRRLGKWKLESVWKLGENEGLDGRLLAETIIKNFKIPVNAWADKEALTFINKGNYIGATFHKYKTSLSLSDRLKLFLFSVRIKEFKKNYIKLSDTSFLREKRLVDGEMGYVLTDTIPQKLMVISSDEYISSRNLKILLVNGTGNFQISNNLGEIIQAIGIKVASIEHRGEKDVDCRITAKDKEVSRRLSAIFKCSVVDKIPGGNFDVEMEFGKIFFERF